MVSPYFQAYSCQKNGRGKRKNQITTQKLLQQQTKKSTNISAIRRKLRDELRNHYLIMLFFNKKIVLPTLISKINQLIRIDDKNSKPTALWLAIFIPMLTDYVVFSSLLKLTVHNTRFPSSRQEKSARSCILIERF